jgi:integrase
MKSAQALPSEGKRPSVRLSVGTVQTLTLPPGKHDYTFFDDKLKGFGLRLRESGSRTFIFQYNIGKITRRILLGSSTAISVAQARAVAQGHYLRVKRGDDPFNDKAVAKQQAAETFKAAVDEYLEMARKTLRPRTYPDIERHLVKYAKPLHGLPLAKIGKTYIRGIVSSVSKNSGEVTGNRCRASLSAFFAWAVAERDLDANPVIGVRRNPEKSRERVLLPAELRVIWNALGNDDYADIIRLLALTGCRAAEIAGLRWSEIHGDVIILPGDRTKNHRQHTIPLSPAAYAIIARRQKREDREFVFGRGQQAFSGWSKCKKRLDAKIKEKNGKALPPWRQHDLRRACASGMQRLGIRVEVIERVLNHVSGSFRGVAGIYQRDPLSDDVRAALFRWADHLAAICEGRGESVVVPLQRA